MSDPSNGITPEVIRQIMPPYQLNPDLLQATLAALPRPPQDATQAWREARVARLIQEISERMPANAAQARTVAECLSSASSPPPWPRSPSRPTQSYLWCAASRAPRTR